MVTAIVETAVTIPLTKSIATYPIIITNFLTAPATIMTKFLTPSTISIAVSLTHPAKAFNALQVFLINS